MAIESDVLVVGGGLAGTTAAISAARTGADVRLVSHKESTFRQASGLIDALGYVFEAGPDSSSRAVRRGPIANPFEALEALPDTHPYSVVGPDGLRDGLALFDDVAGDRYIGGHTETNALIPTFGGTVKPTARYPAAVASGLASDTRPMVLVGFRSMTDSNADLLADGMREAGVPFDVAGVELDVGSAFRDDATVTRFARALDNDEPVDGTPVRTALASAVKRGLDRIDADFLDGGRARREIPFRVGVPAILGLERPREVRRHLEERIGADVFEIPSGPPSLPGRRLERLLRDALEGEGVRYETGIPVVDRTVESEGGTDRVVEAIVDRTSTSVPYRAKAFVLATGGLVGSGIAADRERVVEPVFDCYVPHPADRYDWFVDDAFGDHPFAKFGLRTDDRLRPVGPDGAVTYENVFATGSALGGADVAREKSASGVSLATGVVAGREAAREALD